MTQPDKIIKLIGGVMHVADLDGSNPVILDHKEQLPEGTLLFSRDLLTHYKPIKRGENPSVFLCFKEPEGMELQWQEKSGVIWKDVVKEYAEYIVKHNKSLVVKSNFRQILVRKQQEREEKPYLTVLELATYIAVERPDALFIRDMIVAFNKQVNPEPEAVDLEQVAENYLMNTNHDPDREIRDAFIAGAKYASQFRK